MFTALMPLAAFAINIIVQLLGYRLVSRLNILKSIFLGFGIGLMAFFALSAYDYMTHGRPQLAFLSAFSLNLITYAALGYGYFHFLNLGTTARRIRLLIELSESEEGLAYEEILLRYNAGEMVERRIARLLRSGQVVLRNGRYFIGKPMLLIMANAMLAMKVFILGKASELD